MTIRPQLNLGAEKQRFYTENFTFKTFQIFHNKYLLVLVNPTIRNIFLVRNMSSAVEHPNCA